MYKVVILGVESTHADSFLKFVRDNKKYSDINVEGIYSDECEAVQRLSKEYGVKVMQNYADAAGEVDGVIITARKGSNHLKYALPYIKYGVPMYIDKPITESEDEVREMMSLFEKYNVKFTGGSSCKHCIEIETLKKEHTGQTNGKTLGGLVRCPIDLESIYGGFYFYSQHLAETVISVFGANVLKTYAHRTQDGISVSFQYADFDVTGVYVNHNYKYYVLRLSENGSHGEYLSIGDREFETELSCFFDLLENRSDGADKYIFSKPVFIHNSILRSLESGKAENVGSL